MKKMKKTGKSESRLKEVFARLKENGDKALIAFITAGDPDLKTTEKTIYELEKSGVDIIELGIPFSDPMADGPTIQASSERALKAGTTPAGVFKLVAEVRKKTSIPIVLFGYYNPVFAYGPEKFAREMARAGADGVLVVDLPPEESGEFKTELKKHGLDLIYLLTPTSDDSRMKIVSEDASGFVYYVSVAGVTGARKSLANTSIDKAVKHVRRFTDLPVGVGFGISTPRQARLACRAADGIIVGSAIVNIMAKNQKNKKSIPGKVGDFTATLKRAICPEG